MVKTLTIFLAAIMGIPSRYMRVLVYNVCRLSPLSKYELRTPGQEALSEGVFEGKTLE
jgi:hypothetical protein